MKKYRFTVVTPCYNSEKFIKRVFDSLKKQTFKNFEWYVINDASTDKTSHEIKKFSETVDFPVIFHDLEKNQGVHNNINQAIRDANGEFFILYGHDDEISKDALETFDSLFTKYNSPNIGSIYALAKDQTGKLVGKKYPKDEFISNYWAQFFDLGNEREKFQCWKTDYLREFYPLPTKKPNDQPSSWLWGKFGIKYQSIFINKVLRTYYTNVETSITATSNRESNPNMTFNYHVTWVNEFQYHIKNKKRRYRGVGACVSHGVLSGKSIWQILTKIEKNTNKLICLLFYPIAIYYNKRNK
jgi:glycosyltransferase involved in cell wall biosynthesis